LGGYASVPLAVAAVRAGIPLVLLEQNVVPGRANRLLAPWATVVCTTFAQSARYLSTRPRVVHTGNPVRASIVTRAAARATQADPWRDANPMLLVLGGSQGAHSINQLIVELLPRIASHLTDWEVVHHSGARDECAVRAAYDANRIRSTVTRYIDDVAAVYCRATLAISRAGATTLAELAVCGVPAVLLPYPFAAANHQWHNARAFSRAHAAIIIEDRPGRSAAALASALIPLLREPQMRRELGLAMLKLAEPAAAGAVVSTILSISDTDHRARQSA
jgi:UDP-N-acetylglucosamine--N-acetylmuramyl-(pentapeptide) pyrophosphoryl-undecaprenol N-acetylglucosamine transferase